MPDGPFSSFDHVQLAMPRGEEAAARHFFCDLLGMEEISKPPELATRGGCWFTSGSVQLHLGVEEDFRPSRKAHPALCCGDYAGLVARLKEHQVQGDRGQRHPRVQRCHIWDPFGNRIELLPA